MKVIPAILSLLLAALTIALIHGNSVWNLTPIPNYAGSLIYEFKEASAHAAFASALVASEPEATIPVPVLGVEAGEVADSYGAPRGSDRAHEGVDIFAPRGTYIVSATDGIVVRTGENRLGGNIVFVVGPGGERYYYAHLDSIDPLLAMGQIVSTSTILGRVGTTGNATGTPPHLHFGIYGQGGSQNPYDRLR